LTNFFFLTIARTFEKSREFRVGIGTNSNCYLGTNSNSYLGTNSLVVAWAQILRNSCLGTKLENRIFIGSVCWFCLVNWQSQKSSEYWLYIENILGHWLSRMCGSMGVSSLHSAHHARNPCTPWLGRVLVSLLHITWLYHTSRIFTTHHAAECWCLYYTSRVTHRTSLGPWSWWAYIVSTAV
jgi:hypothetical protein